MPSRRLVQALIVVAIVLVGAGAAALGAIGHGDGGDFDGSAVPPLYSDAQIAPVHDVLRRAEARGHRLARAWLDAHPVASEQQFATWAVAAIGAPPATGTRSELAELHALARSRTPADIRAAQWLEQHGKKQPWKVFRKEVEPFVDAGAYDDLKSALEDAFDLGSRLQAAAKARYRRPSPYVADPSLGALNQARFAGTLRQSYPSKHTVYAGAALAILEPLQPHRSGEYDWMTDEIATSRLYAGGHYRSDLAAGAELGTLIGDYVRRSHDLGP